MLRFVGAAGSVIAIDLGGTRCHGVLADLAGTTIAEDFRPTRSMRRILERNGLVGVHLEPFEREVVQGGIGLDGRDQIPRADSVEVIEQPESLQFVLDRSLHLREAQFDAGRVKGLVELDQGVGGGDIDARDRRGRDHEPADRRR